MTRKEITKDFFSKVLFPLLIAAVLCAVFKSIFTKDGVTDYFLVWILCGIPFGIRRMYFALFALYFDSNILGGIKALPPCPAGRTNDILAKIRTLN